MYCSPHFATLFNQPHLLLIRRHLGKLIYTLAVSPLIPASLVPVLLALQRVIWPQESFRVEKLIEIIADIRHPGLPEGTANESSLANLSYLELKEDAPSLMKCLLVAGEMFKELDRRELNPTLMTLVESLVREHIL